jgi:hypothetical protein
MVRKWFIVVGACMALAVSRPCQAASWQYYVSFETGRNDKAGQP